MMVKWGITFLLVLSMLIPASGPAAQSSPPDRLIRAELQGLFVDPPEVQGYPYQEVLASAAARYGLPLPLILAVVRGESFFDPKARSVKGALGLMQVMPSTAADYGVTPTDLLDPARNADMGVRYLAELHERLEDPYLALGAYYCGPGGVNKETSSLRKDCDEYVRYIYNHLQKILAGSGGIPSPFKEVEDGKTLVLARFDNFLDASSFLDVLSEKLPQLQMDLFRAEANHPGYVRHQYQILLSPDQQKRREEACSAVEKATGFSFCP
jgi:hypothetical protein